MWNTAKSFQNQLTPPSDTFPPHLSAVILPPSLLTLSSQPDCAYTSPILFDDLDSDMNYGNPTSTPYSLSVFLAIHHVCIIRGPPLASPRQQIPPILPRKELQGSKSMQVHRLPTSLSLSLIPSFRVFLPPSPPPRLTLRGSLSLSCDISVSFSRSFSHSHPPSPLIFYLFWVLSRSLALSLSFTLSLRAQDLPFSLTLTFRA